MPTTEKRGEGRQGPWCEQVMGLAESSQRHCEFSVVTGLLPGYSGTRGHCAKRKQDLELFLGSRLDTQTQST